MGPKKEQSIPQKDAIKSFSIEEPVNTDTWRCVVVMAVERRPVDNFLVREFLEEANHEYRQEVKVIDYETVVVKILTEFSNREVPYKYSYLLNYSPLFQEAADCVKNRINIPVQLLAKVVKAILFLFRQESLVRIQNKALGPVDPVQAMSERPSNPNVNGRELTGKSKKLDADSGLKVRPLSLTKLDTKLLKRGEGVKPDQWIDDAPVNGFFSMYVLLTGFYYADLPLALIKADVPFHGLLCIDTSFSGFKPQPPLNRYKYQKRTSGEKSRGIHQFWDSFLKILWDPEVTYFFKDVIFQVYVPQRLLCDEKKLREFIYKEISYLLYDMSDLKRQHNNYLKNMKLWNVGESYRVEPSGKLINELDELPPECVTVPTILQCLMDMICGDDGRESNAPKSVSFDSINTESTDTDEFEMSRSVLPTCGSCIVSPIWSQIVGEKGDYRYTEIYEKVKELDLKYDVDGKSHSSFQLCPRKVHVEDNTSPDMCYIPKSRMPAENMEEAIKAEEGRFSSCFRSYWRKYKREEENSSFSVVLDYCLYSLLIAKVICPYQVLAPEVASSRKSLLKNSVSAKSSHYEIISNLNKEMHKPHFTVTGCSRNILKAIPFHLKDTNRDFFCPDQYKIVTPEKLKASSAPEFHVPPNFTAEISFISDMAVVDEVLKSGNLDVYDNLRDFLGEHLFSNVIDFDFVEELSKPKLLSKEYEFWDNYNCVDYTYSVLIDSLFIVLHNRTDNESMRHETFNYNLKTGVGLRDFFEYVLEDDAEWFAAQEEQHQKELSVLTRNSSQPTVLKAPSDSVFWMENSIKYQERTKMYSTSKKSLKEEKSADWEEEFKGKKKKNMNLSPKEMKKDLRDVGSITTETTFIESEEPHVFEGYNISETAVQYSGLRTTYYVKDSGIDVELVERLYGSQELGVHIREGGHTLHLYSFVCPEPHILQPYICHLTFKNGIVVAFGRRYLYTYDEVEDIVETKPVMSRSKKSSSDLGPITSYRVLRQVPKTVKDEEFLYDMKLSLPNSLTVEVVRRIVNPCYIKQEYLSKYSLPETLQEEHCRLFLPNKSVVVMMSDNTVKIMKMDSTIVTASTEDIVGDEKLAGYLEDRIGRSLAFSRYEITTREGYRNFVKNGTLVSSHRLQIFQNTDSETRTMYFRRLDGTNSVLNADGTLCVEFVDGTKISSNVFAVEESIDLSEMDSEYSMTGENEMYGEADYDSGFLIVYFEVIIEHPDYATIVYNTQTQKWNVILPYNSKITVHPEGNYWVDLDKQTEFKLDREYIQMMRFSPEGNMQCTANVDLTVFEQPIPKRFYCRMEDPSGKSFIVEANSNCYVLTDNSSEGGTTQTDDTEMLMEEEISGETLQEYSCALGTSVQKPRGSKLCRENKYFVVRRDLTGFEIHHKDDVFKVLKNTKKGDIIFTQIMPGTELRCFVLVSPGPRQDVKHLNWQVESIVPNAKFVPTSSMSKARTSTLYGVPPSWMHPFPKKKKKFEMPEEFTCRVFLETKRTDFSPYYGTIDCAYCEYDKPEISYTKMEPGIQNIQKYMMKLANDDQDILQEMYALAVNDILNEKKNLKPVNEEKLKHYLSLSKYYINLRDYHKKGIRFHLVPNYFQHPVGMSWLLLNELIEKLLLRKSAEIDNLPKRPPLPTYSYSLDSESTGEIEYNLSWRSERSFSDLSYRTGLSAKSAPSFMQHGLVCRCKVKDMRQTVSAPYCDFMSTGDPELLPEVESTVKVFPNPICEFKEEDFTGFKKTFEKEVEGNMTLEDLICLGLI